MKPMTPVVPGFKMENARFPSHPPGYPGLPAVLLADGCAISRWHLGWRERLRVLLGGDVWLSMLTFHAPAQPVNLETRCPIMGHPGRDEEV